MGRKQETSVQVMTEAQLPVSEDVLDGLVAQIGQVVNEAPLNLALAVGKLIVEGLYGGNVSAWRDRGPKDTSFRKLAEHPDLPMGPSALYRSVAIYEVCERLGGVAARQHLGFTHYRVVLSLPEPHQDKLLTAAEEKQWSVQKLETEAAKVRKKVGRSVGGGRPPLPVFVKSLNHLRKYANGEDLLLADLDQVEALDNETVQKMHNVVETLQEHLESVRVRLAGVLNQK